MSWVNSSCDLAAFLAPDPAVDGDDGVVAAEQVADPLGQVLQGVAVLGEDDDLAWLPVADQRCCR